MVGSKASSHSCAVIMASQQRLSVLNNYYRYDPIRRPRTTRVLILNPGRSLDPLSGRLATLDLDGPVKYEAVSYTWGKESTQDQITLRGQASRPDAQSRDGPAPAAAAERLARHLGGPNQHQPEGHGRAEQPGRPDEQHLPQRG